MWKKLCQCRLKNYNVGSVYALHAYKYGVMYKFTCCWTGPTFWREVSFEPSLIVITALVCSLGGYFGACLIGNTRRHAAVATLRISPL